MATGASTSVPLTKGYILGGATRDGYLVGAYWTGTVEQVDLIDPATGIGIPVGDLGSFYWSSGQMVYDGARDILYAVGMQESGYPSYLYSLNRQSGAVGVISYPQAAVLAGVTPAGEPINIYYNGSAEQVALLDPTTGTPKTVGTLGDLAWWSEVCTFDAFANVVYAIGSPDQPGNNTVLYELNLSTANTTSVQTAGQYAVLAHQQN